MEFTCIVHSKLYSKNNRKYIDIQIPYDYIEKIRSVHNSLSHKLTKPHIHIPLNHDILTIKVPFKNNRISCLVKGVTTLYEIEPGEQLKVKIQWCGVWEWKDNCGIAWKLVQVDSS